MVGLSLSVDNSQSLTVTEYINRRGNSLNCSLSYICFFNFHLFILLLTWKKNVLNLAKEAVGADETPCGGWSVTRLRSAAHGTLNVPGLSLGVGPRGGLGEHGDAVSRQLILTKVSIVERRPENYEVSGQTFSFILLVCHQFELFTMYFLYCYLAYFSWIVCSQLT